MHLPLLRISLLAAALAALALCLASVAQADLQVAAATVRDANAVEGPIVSRINAVRRAHGLAPLRRSRPLARAASGHAHEMAQQGFFSHTSADGTSPATRIRRHYRGSTVGETILWRSPDVTAAEAVEMWLDSPSHRALLLSPTFRDIGLAAVHVERGSGPFGGRPTTIVVADFGRR